MLLSVPPRFTSTLVHFVDYYFRREKGVFYKVIRSSNYISSTLDFTAVFGSICPRFGLNCLGPENLVCLHVHALTYGHAFDFIDEYAVGFDINLSLKFKPSLHQWSVAALVLGQCIFQFVDGINEISSLVMKLSFDIVSNVFDVWPLFPLLNLLLTCSQWSLKNGISLN